MSIPVWFDPDFRADLRAHVRWLVENRGPQWVEQLEEGLAEAAQHLAELPESGPVEDRIGPTALRKLILRRLPYVIWYVYDALAKDAGVHVLRLFHARQDRRMRAPDKTTRRRPPPRGGKRSRRG